VNRPDRGVKFGESQQIGQYGLGVGFGFGDQSTHIVERLAVDEPDVAMIYLSASAQIRRQHRLLAAQRVHRAQHIVIDLNILATKRTVSPCMSGPQERSGLRVDRWAHGAD
jgi:hypothetical protein